VEFLDTNVLVYAASQQAADQQKAGVARVGDSREFARRLREQAQTKGERDET